MRTLNCFKANDIRGRIGVSFDAGIAGRIARGFATHLRAATVVLGRDNRPSSAALAASIAEGLTAQGCDVLDLGLCGTEEVYFAVAHFRADGGICVTASHNPADYNGMKLVRSGAAPLDPLADLAPIRRIVERGDFATARATGRRIDSSIVARSAYVAHICSYLEGAALKPLKILVNAAHGTAGPTFDAIAARLDGPLRFERVFHDPDGTFPIGVPNPLLPENRRATAEAVIASGADFGVAWDGDFDRCFLFDHTGAFVGGEYLAGLLAEERLARHPGGTVIHDPRVVWNIRDAVARAGGRPVAAPAGHGFIKRAMREHDAVYGGELSGHHYFRHFAQCDSGMIPLLLVAGLVSRHGALAGMVAERRAAFPSSGELNFPDPDPAATIRRIAERFAARAVAQDGFDGLSCDMGEWRFNLRASNTEPLLRLNVEARGSGRTLTRGLNEVADELSHALGGGVPRELAVAGCGSLP